MKILRLKDTLFSTESIGLIATAFGIIYPAFDINTQSQKKNEKPLRNNIIFYEIYNILININNFCKYTYGSIIFDSKVENYYILKFTISNIFILYRLYLNIKNRCFIIINLILTVCSLILYDYIENIFNEKTIKIISLLISFYQSCCTIQRMNGGIKLYRIESSVALLFSGIFWIIYAFLISDFYIILCNIHCVVIGTLGIFKLNNNNNLAKDTKDESSKINYLDIGDDDYNLIYE